MSDENGGAKKGDGVTEEEIKKVEEEKVIEERTVKLEDHRRAVDDMHKYKKEARESRAALEKAEQSRLEEKEDYKTLYEKEKTLRVSSETDAAEIKTKVMYNEKYKAVTQALTKAGLRPEALNMLDNEQLDDVRVDVANGKFIVDGVDTFVDTWKSKYSFLFGNKDVKINTGGGAGGGEEQELTPAYMIQLEVKDLAKYKKLLPKYLEQREQRAKTR